LRTDRLVLREGDQRQLQDREKDSAGNAALAKRARAILLLSEGMSVIEVSKLVGAGRNSVHEWRSRYKGEGLVGLDDRPRSGRPREIPEFKIIVETFRAAPPRYLGTHWSTRSLAQHLGISHSQVKRCWEWYGVKLSAHRAFSFQSDPTITGYRCDLLGLFLESQLDVAVLYVEQRRQVWRIGPGGREPAMVLGRNHYDETDRLEPELYEALREPPSGPARHRPAAALLSFLQHVAQSYPKDRLAVVMHGSGPARSAPINDWFSNNQRVTLHQVQDPAAWLQMMELWLALTDGKGPSVRAFKAARRITGLARDYSAATKAGAVPFAWSAKGSS
jgi:transposase